MEKNKLSDSGLVKAEINWISSELGHEDTYIAVVCLNYELGINRCVVI